VSSPPPADLLLHEPDLAAAPLEVRVESDWLARNAGRLRLTALAIPSVFFASFPLAGIVAWSTASEPVGALALFGTWGALALGLPLLQRTALWRRQRHAQEVIQSWRRLELSRQDASRFEAAPAAESPTAAIVAMRDRILALSEAAPVHQAAHRAVARATQLSQERAHLLQAAEGAPQAQPRLLEAAERIDAELARLQAGLAEVWTRLLEAPSDGDVGLDEALRYVEAEAEVARSVVGASVAARQGQPGRA